MTREHAGIEMDLAFGSVKPYGSSRSIVRRIATSLPLKPCPRVHFQLHPYPDGAGSLNSSTAEQNGFVASLADVAWIERGAGDTPARLRSGTEAQPGFIFRSHQQQSFRPLKRQRSLPSLQQEAPEPQGPATVNQEAIQKISVLENELAKLRAQIAQIVLVQEQNAQPAATAPAAPAAAPALPGGAPPPPPPPPLPPPPPPGLQRSISAMDLIKERRGKKTTVDSGPKQPEIPSMLDVLKDIGKVKLRSVKSRPGEGHAKLKPSDPMDAASLIAEALKRKFAHRYQTESRTESWGESDFSLPAPKAESPTQSPMFGQHMLKPTGKKKLC